MRFIQGRLRVSEAEKSWLLELLASLNGAHRKACSVAQKEGWDPRTITAAKILGESVIEHGVFTSHQEGMIARKAGWEMKTRKSLAEVAIQRQGESIAAIEKKIESMRAAILELRAPKSAFEKETAFARRRAEAKRLQERINKLMERKQGLASKKEKLEKQLQEGQISRVFGGRKLLRQREMIGGVGSAFKTKSEWRDAWDRQRNGSWLFEGHKAAAAANRNAKYEAESGELRIRLTESQANRRMEERAKELGVELAELKDKTIMKWSPERMACRYLTISVEWGEGCRRQKARLEELRKALTPNEKGECGAPIGWRLMLQGDQVLVRAEWQSEDVELVSWEEAGCLGVDINAESLEWSICSREGNKPSKQWIEKHGDWKGRLDLDWKEGRSTQTLHEVRVAARRLVDKARDLRMPLAVEALDFGRKKVGLRYEDPKRAKALSGLAYGKLIEAIKSRAKKVGVELRMVNPAFTSVAGWVKYGSRLGLNADEAAAFAIARRGLLSKGEHVKKFRKKGKAVELRGKPEKLPKELKALIPQEDKKETNDKKIQKSKPAKSKTSKAARARRSEEPTRNEWTAVASALGRDRSAWGRKLQELRREGRAMLDLQASSSSPMTIGAERRDKPASERRAPPGDGLKRQGRQAALPKTSTVRNESFNRKG